MKKLFTLTLALCCVTALLAQGKTIRICTNQTDLILKTSPEGRLYQSYLGERLLNESDIEQLPYFFAGVSENAKGVERGWETYPGSGGEDFFEPALNIRHNDGNGTTILKYISHKSQNSDPNTTHTQIAMRDEVYGVDVMLHYVTYAKENIIKSWSEISHNQKRAINMESYASSMLYFSSPAYHLTEFSGDWAKEMQPGNHQLTFGKKIVDTKLGSRASMHAYPFFILGLGEEPHQTQGTVLMGTVAWTGNFRFTFEVDNLGNLRIISGINPYASNYPLATAEIFRTPEFIFTLDNNGTDQASRNLHDWARQYQIKDGMGDRLTLLNNWEATGFNFDQEKLSKIMIQAKELGVDMFLLDDGWFANKYLRQNDRAGLGDWDATKSKLPGGVPALVKAAKDAGVKFGIWIEPEMVNPKSELFEKHPQWAITQSNREPYYYRNQLVLDMSNPQVQDYVFGVLDDIMKENPDVAYFKWDCNSPITNIHSPYLKEQQNKLYVDHVRGVYKVFERVKQHYPNLPLMLCSGGGARCDYQAMKYFTEFWASDNTDPIERLYIQWSFSQFFPAKAISAHVTSWNSATSIKFRVDVAMMCKLGFDISLEELSDKERQFCSDAVANYKRLKDVIYNGDMHHLVSPHGGNHTAVAHVSKDGNRAVLYTYDIHPRFSEKTFAVKMRGLNPTKNYEVREINLMPGVKSSLRENGKIYSGDYLMKVGVDAFTSRQTSSRLIEVIAQN